ncbi:hypothetical protein KP509_22G059600 [Ceratopteris richardii]|uniref:Cell division topological specificity factor n=1 Tax=Ceratopteris richardii TaxID=49495 RepID=A0A8T2S5P6_CERRI|nr:hypothetical protein KP509_22G059600 [Ceratopteris richardii]
MSKPISNAAIAKQRLKMILVSDRCAISEDAKRKIVDNVVLSLSAFVEIDSEENVQLNVSADADVGTLYSVIVPVRRVKPQYHEYNDAFGSMGHEDVFEKMRKLDVRLEYSDNAERE